MIKEIVKFLAVMKTKLAALALILLLPLGAFAAVPSLDQMLSNLNSQFPSLYRLVTAFAYIAGFFIVFRGLYQMKHMGEGRAMGQQNDMKGPILSLLIGAALIYTPSFFSTSLITIFGTSSITSYPTGSHIDPSFNEMGQTLVTIVQFVGGIALVRGILIFHRLGHGQAQQGTFGKGVTHVIGGILLINIVGFADVIGSTLGISIS